MKILNRHIPDLVQSIRSLTPIEYIIILGRPNFNQILAETLRMHFIKNEVRFFVVYKLMTQNLDAIEEYMWKHSIIIVDNYYGYDPYNQEFKFGNWLNSVIQKADHNNILIYGEINKEYGACSQT